jgi:hypothetical protein
MARFSTGHCRDRATAHTIASPVATPCPRAPGYHEDAITRYHEVPAQEARLSLTVVSRGHRRACPALI